MPDLELVKWIAQQGAGWFLALIVLLLYRRDHMDKQTRLIQGHQRRDEREDQLLRIAERSAGAFEQMSSTLARFNDTLQQHHASEIRWYEQIGRDLVNLGTAHHNMANLINQALGRMGSRP